MNKKVLSCALMGATVANSVLPVMATEITYPHMDKVQYDENGNSVAEVHEEVDVTTDSTSTTNVYAELGKEFLVTIPKSLTLDGTTKKGAYTVEVEGDIAGTDVVKVVPDETFALKSTGLNDVTANIEQDKTEWGYDEILEDSAVIGNGEIDAQGLTAGAWEGTFNFNINLEEDGTGTETESKLTLSADDVAMGTGESVQVNAYLDGELANDKVEWTSDNENITVTDGLVETKASAQVGDTATVTVTAEDEETLTAMANVLSDLGIATVASADNTLEAKFTVTIVDMAFTFGDEEITSLDIKAGESAEVEVTIIPASASGTVNWSTTAVSGINLVKNGNKVTVKVADDMETGKTYNLIATYGNYSKEIQINIVADHVCNYENEEITKNATCTEVGIKTLTCSECGKTKTEEIPVDPDAHNFENGTCTECSAEDPNYLEAGLYDANGVMLASWDEAGIDAERNYRTSGFSDSWDTCVTSGYYILTNKYPTTTKIVFPESITNIGEQAFRKCTGLKDVIFSSSIENIGYFSFSYCENLTNVIIPEGVVSIEGCAFTSTKMTEIFIPSTVTNLAGDFILSSPHLTTISVSNKNLIYNSNDNCNAIIETAVV